jgi:hypothetical protein
MGETRAGGKITTGTSDMIMNETAEEWTTSTRIHDHQKKASDGAYRSGWRMSPDFVVFPMF